MEKEFNKKMQQAFEVWFLETIPNAAMTSTGKLKMLVGNMYVKFYDLPEPMQRGAIEDFKKHYIGNF